MKYSIDELIEKAKNGDALSKYILGRIYYFGDNGVEKDKRLGYEFWADGYLTNKDPRCAFGVALTFMDGFNFEDLDVNKNEFANSLMRGAYRGIRELANTGDDNALFLLGEYYNRGLGKENEDPGLAFYLYEESAERDNPEGCCMVGFFYEYGFKGLDKKPVVQKNKTKAEYYYQKGSDLGSRNANFQLRLLREKKDKGL